MSENTGTLAEEGEDLSSNESSVQNPIKERDIPAMEVDGEADVAEKENDNCPAEEDEKANEVQNPNDEVSASEAPAPITNPESVTSDQPEVPMEGEPLTDELEVTEDQEQPPEMKQAGNDDAEIGSSDEVTKTDENLTVQSEKAAEEDMEVSSAQDTPTEATSESTSDNASASPPEDTDASASSTAADDAATPSTSSEGATAAAPAKNSEKSPLQSVYHIKWIRFKENMYPIVTQNENGPCPLIAIINLLVLQGKVKMPSMIEMVTSGQLMEYLADCIFEHAPKDISEDARLNYEQNMHDAMAVFHKLQTGLDVNVKFTSVSTFEYTPECIVFDLLGLPLYHGWLVDPDTPNEVAAVGNCGYNQLVEKIITQKNSSREELVTEALIAEEFLNRTAAQLTYHGLSELSTTLKEDQMCVFFRNNHFSTLYKRKNELFLLVTDQGFLTESNVVWETLSNVEGDGLFVDANFRTYQKPDVSTHTIPQSSVPIGSAQQVDQDYLVALSLQEEQSPCQASSQISPSLVMPHEELSDHELAMRLQEEENRQAKMRQQQQQQMAANQQLLSQQHQQQQRLEAKDRKKDKSDCVIL